MFDVEKRLAEAADRFKLMKEFVQGEGQDLDAYAVERRVFQDCMGLGLHLMAAYFACKRGGDVGPVLETAEGERLPRERLKSRRYLNIFGELELYRYYYHEDGARGVFPLDEDVNLPARRYSYLVQELLGQRVARMPYDEAIEDIERVFGFHLDKHNMERVVPEQARDVDAYYEAQGTPPPETEAEVLVAAIDGKGVPIVKDKPAERKVRLAKGEKRSHKKEAVVSAVYTIAAEPRTADDVVRELRDREPRPERPKPQNKRVRATLKGKKNGFDWVKEEIRRRDPKGRKLRVCLMDGSRGLWKLALLLLTGFTFILDIFHATEYLWKAAHAFHPEGSDDAEAFVRRRLRMLCEGKVGRVIGGLRQMLTKRASELSASQRRTLEKVIDYYEANRAWMRYDEYLAAGYPIGSGAVEGACRHLVKDRMEGSGMRWTVVGAEAVLKVRAAHLNGDWDAFWHFHMEQEAARRFGGRQWRAKAPPTRREAAA